MPLGAGLPETVLPETVPPETVPDAPDDAGEAFPLLCVGEPVPAAEVPAAEVLAVGDEPLADGVGLPAADVAGDAFGRADVLAFAVGLPQTVPAFRLSRFLVLLALALAVAVVWLLAAFAAGVALALALGPPLPEEPVAGLAGELGGGVDGPGEVAAVAGGLDEASVALAEGVADDCVQEASGVGRWRWAAVEAELPIPPAAAWPR